MCRRRATSASNDLVSVSLILVVIANPELFCGESLDQDRWQKFILLSSVSGLRTHCDRRTDHKRNAMMDARAGRFWWRHSNTAPHDGHMLPPCSSPADLNGHEPAVSAHLYP